MSSRNGVPLPKFQVVALKNFDDWTECVEKCPHLLHQFREVLQETVEFFVLYGAIFVLWIRIKIRSDCPHLNCVTMVNTMSTSCAQH